MASSDGEIAAVDEVDTNLAIDIDDLFDILDGEPSSDPNNQNSQVNSFSDNLSAESAFDSGTHENFCLQSGFQMLERPYELGDDSGNLVMYPVYNPETSGAGNGGLGGSFNSAGNSTLVFGDVMVEPSSNNSSSRYPCSGSLEDFYQKFQEVQGMERVGVTEFELLSCSAPSSSAKVDSNCVPVSVSNFDLNCLSETSNRSWMDGWGGPLDEHHFGISGPGNDIHTISFMDADVFSSKSTVCCNSDITSELGAQHSDMRFCINADGTSFADSPQYCLPADFNLELFPTNEVIMTEKKDEMGEFRTESGCSASEMHMIDHSYEKGVNYNGVIDGKYSLCNGSNLHFNEDLNQSLHGISPSFVNQKPANYRKDGNDDTIATSEKAIVNGFGGRFPIYDAHLNLNTQPSTISNKQLIHSKNETVSKLIEPTGSGSHLSRVSPESIQSNSSGSKSHIDDDSDLCILEDISQPAPKNPYPLLGKPIVPLQSPAYGNSLDYSGVGAMRFRATDERFIFRAALQGLSQPNTEASLPAGVLAVSLLRHQRIALSWMVDKETSGVHCSGGILADDQGLGKTVSTIALILKERPPSFGLDAKVLKKEELETLDLDRDDDEVIEVNKRPSFMLDAKIVKEEEFETIDLDKDDDKVTEVKKMKEGVNGIQVIPSQSSMRSLNSCAKGRPAGGTLVVCPTSVLRQWAEELRKKVSSEAKLSVLVYHGSSRTKDPCELAKYDVVLTTYSIVSMEVPKQPLGDEDDDEKRKLQIGNAPSLGLSSGKKRKYPLGSDKKGPKNKKGLDGALFDTVARPLAKVGWFRVVLDEAQSIKNHRTQVARACWGLRAKRRWCLSGTPIQNAIDDLYSYFRFLRYDPFAAYKSFCSTIKVPIQKNPARGYKRLQAVLKTIMLRRTKGTLIDGEPIINLPPKDIELKKVEFTEEERDFYTKLEADSRAQFKEYAAAGTVKQNYVNILLMLLRLRQACDHPLLVRGTTSNSLGRSSIEMAKKLPLEKRVCLLKCLEASLAICGICNDPPEDAVVSICGHVFCNQCICEHLSDENNQCPSTNCKVRLNVSSVFSKTTLNGCLSNQPVQDDPGSKHETFDSYAEGCPYDSSKIRAALEVLQSLTKPHDCTSKTSSSQNSANGNVTSSENSSTSGSDNAYNKNAHIDKDTNISMKVFGEKAIVFSQWTKMLDLLEACLKNSSIQFRRLDGTMSVVARDKAVKDFNTLPEVSVMIMSLKAASLGLNMVAACHVLLLDLWWNPTTEDQAIDRAHRIGQTRRVTVLRLTVKDTVEDRILALQQKKREMVASAFGEDETGGRQTRLTVQDLEYLFS